MYKMVFLHLINLPMQVPTKDLLGPLLFLMYINDTSCDVTSNLRTFADDNSFCYVCSLCYVIVDHGIISGTSPLIELFKLSI